MQIAALCFAEDFLGDAARALALAETTILLVKKLLIELFFLTGVEAAFFFLSLVACLVVLLSIVLLDFPMMEQNGDSLRLFVHLNAITWVR